ncbi:ABC transporter ATP-binding protein [Streptomyces hygroscopicus]|uniref:ABC transporter ATP-binding protein n=1 Tax=Streptomyces hygroscopicus TaxID=1912 RepID=UPI00099E90BE|nr:ABC transporter ATP-binding protein [Streptomyces hygroscopicus]GLV76392.1 ABC transporter ATP-binding protein [Streptomyces hygroscopicus subsp. hygroscopicus]
MPTDPGARRAEGATVSALALRAVSKRYGATTALEGIDLEIAEGEIMGLLGHNGAGKTTLMSLVAGLLRPDTGKIEIHGVPTDRDPRRARRDLGLAPQELGVYPPLTVRQNLRFCAELAGLRGQRARVRTEEVAEPFGLTALLDRRVSGLSGGEQRRVHTAMALLHRPKLVLLDEPTAGVDVETRARLIAYVKELADDGTAVCYSTHYLPEVEALEASVAVLDHGRLIARGTLPELVRSHADSAVELTFHGGVPPLRLPWPVTHDEDGVLRVHVEQPQLATADVLAALGESARLLVNMRVVQPSLESAFLRLTGSGAPDRRPPASPAPSPVPSPAPSAPRTAAPAPGAPANTAPARGARAIGGPDEPPGEDDHGPLARDLEAEQHG